VAYDHGLTHRVRANVLTGDPSFVDNSGLGSTTLLHSPLGERGFATGQLVWNQSIERLVLLPDALPPDAFAVDQAQLGQDGSVVVDGRPLTGPLLVDAYGATTRFRGTRLVDRTRLYKLLAPAGTPRLAFYMPGRYYDGWLSLDGGVQLWPERSGAPLAGRLDLELSLPPDGDPVLVRFDQGGKARSFPVRPGEVTAVSLLVCSQGPWKANFSAPFTGSVGSRFVSVHSTEPVFRADSSACP
jgi:hypothetical protein